CQVRRALLEAGHDCPREHQVDNGTDTEDVEFKIQCDDNLTLETVTEEYVEDLDNNVASLHALTDLPNTPHGPARRLHLEGHGPARRHPKAPRPSMKALG